GCRREEQIYAASDLVRAANIGDDEIEAVDNVGVPDVVVVAIPDDVDPQLVFQELLAVPGFATVTAYEIPPTPPLPFLPDGTLEQDPRPTDITSVDEPATALLPVGWSTLTNAAPSTAGVMMLLSNGSVMVEGGGTTNVWNQLTPSVGGGYSGGVWSSLASMGTQRLYFGSNVLP